MNPRISDLKTSAQVKRQLMSGHITKELKTLTGGRNKEIFLVELDNGVQAVFKNRESIDLCGEIMAYEIATHLFKLPSTIPPAVRKSWKGMNGVLQYYIPSDVVLDESNRGIFYQALEKITNNICLESYANLQIFKYIAGLQDFSFSSLSVWLNTNNKYVLTAIDNAYLSPQETKYGRTIYGAVDITTNFYYGYTTQWTSFFSHDLIDVIRAIKREDYAHLFEENGFDVTEDELEMLKVFPDIFMHNCNQILAWVGSKEQRLTAFKGRLFSVNPDAQLHSHPICDLISDYDFKWM